MTKHEYINRFWKLAFTMSNQQRPQEHINRFFRFFHPSTRA